MPLVKETIKNEIESELLTIFKAGQNGEIKTIEEVAAKMAESLSDAIDAYIRSGTVNTTVTTTAGSGTGTGKLS